jgi:serine/threonine-protein kinase
MEPPHLASFTTAQRADILLWNGRISLLDRVNAMRGYTLLTVAAAAMSVGMVAVAFQGAIPLILSPIVPAYMALKLRRRGRSLRESGLRLRRVFLTLRARKVIPALTAAPSEEQLLKLAPRDVLDSPHGAAIRKAAEDRAAILDIAGKLSKEDRAQLRDLEPTVDALVGRVASVAQTALRLEEGIDPRLAEGISARIAAAEREGHTLEGERRLTLLHRQRATIEEIAARRLALTRQMENAGLALGNLRLDLIKLRSSGLQSALTDVSTATQEARALSREIGLVLEAVAEMERFGRA